MDIRTALVPALLAVACSSDHVSSHSTFSIDHDEGNTRRITHVTDGLSRSVSPIRLFKRGW